MPSACLCKWRRGLRMEMKVEIDKGSCHGDVRVCVCRASVRATFRDLATLRKGSPASVATQMLGNKEKARCTLVILSFLWLDRLSGEVSVGLESGRLGDRSPGELSDEMSALRAGDWEIDLLGS